MLHKQVMLHVCRQQLSIVDMRIYKSIQSLVRDWMEYSSIHESMINGLVDLQYGRFLRHIHIQSPCVKQIHREW